MVQTSAVTLLPPNEVVIALKALFLKRDYSSRNIARIYSLHKLSAKHDLNKMLLLVTT